MGSLSHRRAKTRVRVALAQQALAEDHDTALGIECNATESLFENLLDETDAETLNALAREYATDPSDIDFPD